MANWDTGVWDTDSWLGSAAAQWDAATWDSALWDTVLAGLQFTTDDATLVGSGRARASGSLSFTTGAASLSATGRAGLRGTLNFTTAPATLSGAGKVALRGGLNVVAASIVPSYSADVLARANLSFTTGNATLSATNLPYPVLAGNLNITTSGVTFVGLGRAALAAGLSVTAAGVTFIGESLGPVFGDLNINLAPATLVGVSIASAPQQEVGSMTEALYNWLSNRGFSGTLDDMINEYLKSEVAGSSDTDTTNDLWKKLAAQEGYVSETLEGIQIEWAKIQGAPGDTWNDVFRNLPA
jgi:hypothetical protein